MPDNKQQNPLLNYSNAAYKGLTHMGNGMIGDVVDTARLAQLLDPSVAEQAKQIIAEANQNTDAQNPTYPGISSWLGDNISGNPAILSPGGPIIGSALGAELSAVKNTDPNASILQKEKNFELSGLMGALTGKYIGKGLGSNAPTSQAIANYLNKQAPYISPVIARLSGSGIGTQIVQ